MSKYSEDNCELSEDKELMGFKMINVLTDEGEVIASISKENIIEKDGYRVECI